MDVHAGPQIYIGLPPITKRVRVYKDNHCMHVSQTYFMEVRDVCICVEYLRHNIDVVHAFKIAQVPTQSKRFMTCRVLAPSIQRDGLMCTYALLYM